MRINIISAMDGSGVGRHARYFYQDLQAIAGNRLDIRHIDPDDTPSLARAIVDGNIDDVTIFFLTQNPELLRKFKGKKILWCAFESSRMPSKLIQLINAFDEVWTPSAWGRGIMIDSGITPAKVKIVPEGVDTQTYAPQARVHEGFVFLSLAKYEKRKGLDELILAYSSEFPAPQYPDVALWLKPDFPLFPERLPVLKSRLSADVRIKIFEGYVSDGDMADLYNDADAFVFPSRAEGFGLPCLEALSCGIPVIAVNYSGQTEYLKTIPGLYAPIDYKLDNIVDSDFDYFYKELYATEPYGQWAAPDIASLRAAMRDVYEKQALWKRKGAEAAAIIRQQFDWRYAVEKALRILGMWG